MTFVTPNTRPASLIDVATTTLEPAGSGYDETAVFGPWSKAGQSADSASGVPVYLPESDQ